MSVKTASGLCKRIIPCLDVAHGRTVKGIKFTGLRDAGDPVALALAYEEQGADELVFLDIRASHEGRSTTIDLVEKVAAKLSIPFTVGVASPRSIMSSRSCAQELTRSQSTPLP